MPHLTTRRHSTAFTAAIALVLVGILLAACGGSSSGSTGSSSTGSTASASASASTTVPPRPGASRFAALRACLQKDGVTLPNRTPGQRPSSPGGFLGGPAGGPALPKGVTRAQYQAALRKCVGALAGRFKGGVANSPASRQAFVRFAACMRENGVNLPPPNTTGNGPIFSTKGSEVASPKFKAAEVKCATALRGRFARPGGGSSGAPPAGAGG